MGKKNGWIIINIIIKILNNIYVDINRNYNIFIYSGFWFKIFFFICLFVGGLIYLVEILYRYML